MNSIPTLLLSLIFPVATFSFQQNIFFSLNLSEHWQFIMQHIFLEIFKCNWSLTKKRSKRLKHCQRFTGWLNAASCAHSRRNCLYQAPAFRDSLLRNVLVSWFDVLLCHLLLTVWVLCLKSPVCFSVCSGCSWVPDNGPGSHEEYVPTDIPGSNTDRSTLHLPHWGPPHV